MQTQVYPHVPVDPNDPRLHTPEDEPRFRKAQSRELHALNYHTKAARLDSCLEFWRWLRRKGCSPWKECTGRCELHSCVNCALYNALVMLRKYGPLGATKLIHDQIIFAEFCDDRDWTPEQCDDISKRLTRISRASHQQPLVVTRSSRGPHNRRQTVRIVYGGAETADMRVNIAAEFPTAHISVRPKSEWETVLALALDPQLSQDPAERAYFEHMYHRVRVLRISGISKQDLAVYGGKDYTVKCQIADPRHLCPDCGEPCVRTVPACPCCGEPPEEVSEWLRQDQKDAKLDDLRWSRVQPAPKTPHIMRN